MNKGYIITGIGGHLGNTIAGMLTAQGAEVRGLAMPDEKCEMLDSSVKIIRGDVRDISSVEPLFTGWEEGCRVTVIHAAGIITISSKFNQNVVDVNVGGTKNIIELCKRHSVSKLVYISSVHAIKESPKSKQISETGSFSAAQVKGLYAKTKAEATRLVLDSAKEGLNVSVVHPSGIIGPNDYGSGHMTQMVIDYVKGVIRAAVRGGFDFVDVRDVADGVLKAAENGKSGEGYILSNQYIPVKNLLNILHELTGRKKIKIVLPMWLVKIFEPLAVLYFKVRKLRPLFTSYMLDTLKSNSNFSHEKASRELGYKPRDLRITLVDTVKFLTKTGRIRLLTNHT
ncbi:MAG: NAD-dependent epimerase/dehydratase family protein [Eubacteriales bacterium]|nr:NAD-dependent epimerase/dehydratase family protein [Eubacteriales bacterium]